MHFKNTFSITPFPNCSIFVSFIQGDPKSKPVPNTYRVILLTRFGKLHCISQSQRIKQRIKACK